MAHHLKGLQTKTTKMIKRNQGQSRNQWAKHKAESWKSKEEHKGSF
jgi:hypothetical protein